MAEQASVDVSERLRAIIEMAFDAYLEVDGNNAIIEWSPQAEETFGWSRSEAIGMASDMFIPVRDREEYHEMILACSSPRQVPASMRRFRITALRRDGTEFPIELAIAAPRPGTRTVPRVRQLSPGLGLAKERLPMSGLVPPRSNTGNSKMDTKNGLSRVTFSGKEPSVE